MPEEWHEKPGILGYEDQIRAIAREEVASLAGFMLRRLQDRGLTRSPDHNFAIQILNELWGEALRDFSATPREPGP